MQPERKLFGTDGIRGVANEGYMTPEMAFRVGLAVTYQCRTRLKRAPRIVIGKDTRVSGYLFETALASGICAQGGRVLLCGPMPTPAIAHLTQSMRADAGIVISASHNPFQDNGIKIFARDGFKLPDEDEAALEALMANDVLDTERPKALEIGRAERINDAIGRYIAFVKSTFPSDLDLNGIKVVVDAANGAAYRVAPTIFSELGAQVFAMGIQPNGRNINERCGATSPDACAREVLRHSAQIGIALDGDADRVILIDEKGQQMDGDAIMALCASHMLKNGSLAKNTVVATIMSNLGLERALAKQGGRVVRCAVGDRYVVETMRQGKYNFGGESSGHMVFLDHSTTGDGLIAALQMLAIACRVGEPVSALGQRALDKVPQTMVNVTCKEKRPLTDLPDTSRAIEDVERKLGNQGRVIVRWSGTEPKLRILVEGDDAQTITQLANNIAEEARRELGGANPSP